jgi:hypothetical protein
MSHGCADIRRVDNSLVTERAPLQDFVRFHSARTAPQIGSRQSPTAGQRSHRTPPSSACE